jgi:thiamine pyrophosphokinase
VRHPEPVDAIYAHGDMIGTVLIFSGGDAPSPGQVAALPKVDLVIAADSGIDRAQAAGCVVDIGIGDFDSVTASGYVQAERSGAQLVRHSTTKDETDLELAMNVALESSPRKIIVLALDGGRPDHYLANLALLADRRFASVEIDAAIAGADVAIVHNQRPFTGRVGQLLSILPIGGDAHGVRTNGLEYPLVGETLPAGSPRGISNVFSSPVAVVSVDDGVLLVIRPE